MTREALKAMFPNASVACIALNDDSEAHRDASRPKSKLPVQMQPVAEKAGEARHADRFHVRIVSFRRRLCDPDNLCPKYFVDCARYAGFIPDDRAQDITLEVQQEKVKTKAEERTEITIDEPI